METESTPFLLLSHNMCNVKEKGCDWTPAMAVAGSTLLKNRNMHMNATASLISLMVRQSATQVCI